MDRQRLCPACQRLRPASHFYTRSGNPRCVGSLRWTQARRFQLMTLVDQGYSNAQIGQRMGISANAVKTARRRYGIGGVLNHALSARDVAETMGVRCAKTVTRWIVEGYLEGKQIRRMGPYRGWMVQRSDIYAFVEDERTWHLWTPERITDRQLLRHAERVRSKVRFLTPREVAERMYVQVGTVNQWIHKGYLPARRWGNHRIDERDLERFELPRIGGRRLKNAA